MIKWQRLLTSQCWVVGIFPEAELLKIAATVEDEADEVDRRECEELMRLPVLRILQQVARRQRVQERHEHLVLEDEAPAETARGDFVTCQLGLL